MDRSRKLRSLRPERSSRGRAKVVLREDPTFEPAKALLARIEGFSAETDDFDSDNDQTVLAPVQSAGPSPLPSAPALVPIPPSESVLQWLDDDAPAKALDENVQFTVYRPPHLIADQWTDVLFFAHLDDRRPQAPPDSPDPQAEVQRIAESVLGNEAEVYDTNSSDARAAIPKDGTLTVIPAVEEVTFNPPKASFVWSEDVHHVQFRARSTSANKTLRGVITVFYGAVLVGDVPIALKVEPDGAMALAAPTLPTEGRRYRKIFASYSRRDLPIVRSFETFARAIGDRYLLDLLDLRAGEEWSKRLEDMIRSADVFQLFWSRHAMESAHVLEEVQFALALNQDIRPVFWERPLPQDATRNLPPASLARFHFQFLAPMTAAEEGPEDFQAPYLAPPTDEPDLAPNEEQADPSLIACPACGQPNLRSDKDCVRCGQSLATSIHVIQDEADDAFDSNVTRALDSPLESRSPSAMRLPLPRVDSEFPPPSITDPFRTPVHGSLGHSRIEAAPSIAGPGGWSVLIGTAFGLAVLIVTTMLTIWYLMGGKLPFQ